MTLKDDSNEYKKILHYLPCAVIRCMNDQGGTILDVNQGFLHMFGFSREELTERFHNHFIEMAYRPDYERFLSENGLPLKQKENISFHFRILCKSGNYKWVLGSIQIVREGDDKEQVYCVMLDTDKDWREIDDLRLRAERDALTGLYNREETQLRVGGHLGQNPAAFCALFIIDTDNFKQVNDTLGHLMGDAVLTELASAMKRMVRQNDVAGRIGGDEFLIFLKDIPSAGIAREKASKLLEVFRHLFQGEKRPFEITCSVGVAMYPEDGKDFQTLYRNADQALYQAKSKGKNQYVLYGEEAGKHVINRGYSALGASIDSNQKIAEDADNIVSYVFQILYDTDDLSSAIQMILEIVGLRFDVSRAYVFENTEDGQYCNNTYEWCNAGIEPQRNNLQHFKYDGLEGYQELFKDDSIFYCRDIQALQPKQVALFESQGVCSTLQCAIREQGGFSGFVGFDECTGMRLWTKEEIGMLSLIAQLLTIFLQKKRVSDRDHQLALRLNTILDTQDAYIYTIKKDDFELIYLNYKTRALDPNAKVGMTCHQAFFEREQPCENCPLTGNANEVYNPRYGLWTRVRVSPIKWGEYDAYLLTCFDITEYKIL